MQIVTEQWHNDESMTEVKEDKTKPADYVAFPATYSHIATT